MIKLDIQDEYYNWLYSNVIYDEDPQKPSFFYGKLTKYLHNVDFTCTIPLDINRAEDGINLRYRFGRESRLYSFGCPDYDSESRDVIIATYLDIRPCSVFEMMVALAIRCEEMIMNNSQLGNRTPLWFFEMIKNLGLSVMDDYHFNEFYASEIVRHFLEREYSADGKGGLFQAGPLYKNTTPFDFRNVEIWGQAMWYLSTYYPT